MCRARVTVPSRQGETLGSRSCEERLENGHPRSRSSYAPRRFAMQPLIRMQFFVPLPMREAAMPHTQAVT